MNNLKRRLPLVLVFLLLASSTACFGSKETPATPKAAVAMTADAIVIRVNELQATVIQACGPDPACQPNSLPTALARDLVKTCIDVRTVLKTVPDGWRVTVKATWNQAKPRFVSVTNPAILAAMSAVDALIGGL